MPYFDQIALMAMQAAIENYISSGELGSPFWHQRALSHPSEIQPSQSVAGYHYTALSSLHQGLRTRREIVIGRTIAAYTDALEEVSRATRAPDLASEGGLLQSYAPRYFLSTLGTQIGNYYGGSRDGRSGGARSVALTATTGLSAAAREVAQRALGLGTPPNRLLSPAELGDTLSLQNLLRHGPDTYALQRTSPPNLNWSTSLAQYNRHRGGLDQALSGRGSMRTAMNNYMAAAMDISLALHHGPQGPNPGSVHAYNFVLSVREAAGLIQNIQKSRDHTEDASLTRERHGGPLGHEFHRSGAVSVNLGDMAQSIGRRAAPAFWVTDMHLPPVPALRGMVRAQQQRLPRQPAGGYVGPPRPEQTAARRAHGF